MLSAQPCATGAPERSGGGVLGLLEDKTAAQGACPAGAWPPNKASGAGLARSGDKRERGAPEEPGYKLLACPPLLAASGESASTAAWHPLAAVAGTLPNRCVEQLGGWRVEPSAEIQRTEPLIGEEGAGVLGGVVNRWPCQGAWLARQAGFSATSQREHYSFVEPGPAGPRNGPHDCSRRSNYPL